MIKPKVVLLIFVSGKIVLTGAKVIFFSSLFSRVVDAFITLLFFLTNTSYEHAMIA